MAGTGCKAKVNGYAGNMGGSPKSTTGGKDIGPHATNSMEKFTNRPVSPNANAASCNHKRKY